MSLPGAPHLAYRGNDLCLEDRRLADLAREFGTPLYVYSRAAMLDALAGYETALAGRDHLICYAMKANSNLAVLQTFARAGCGFDIVSAGELERVLAAGGDAAKVVFSGVGKTRAEMGRALEAGVMCFNVESDAELDVLSEVASSLGRTARISLRVNPDVDARTHPYISTGLKDNKFGIPHSHAVEAFLRARDLPGLEVVGIDCHIGSQITDSGPYMDALDRVLDLVEEVESHGVALHHLDLGGGLGITYTDETPPAARDLVGSLLERIDARGHGRKKVLLEPGRSLVGNAGVLLTEVLYLKQDKAAAHADSRSDADADPGGKSFCIVDAAMNDLMRPAMYGAWMKIVECTRGAEPAQLWDVVGPVCESGDWLGRDRSLAARPGDVLAVLSAGAYGMSMASNYNSRPRPAEILVDRGDARLIRRRENTADLFAHEMPVA